MKNVLKIVVLSLMLISPKVFSQETSTLYQPAKAVKEHYKALYVISDSDANKIKSIIRNIENAMDDPRLKGKLSVELLAFGAGVEMYKKTNPYGTLLAELKKRGVTMVQCENTMREKHIEKSELFDFVNYTPSGNGEIILREYEGWAVVKP